MTKYNKLKESTINEIDFGIMLLENMNMVINNVQCVSQIKKCVKLLNLVGIIFNFIEQLKYY